MILSVLMATWLVIGPLDEASNGITINSQLRGTVLSLSPVPRAIRVAMPPEAVP